VEAVAEWGEGKERAKLRLKNIRPFQKKPTQSGKPTPEAWFSVKRAVTDPSEWRRVLASLRAGRALQEFIGHGPKKH
jgi:hypothetical protein